MSLAAPSDLAIAVLVATLAYLVFHVLAHHAGAFGPRRGWWRRAIGIPTLGLGAFGPVLLLDLPELSGLGLRGGDLGLTLGLSVGIVAALVPLLYLQSRRPGFLRHYPEVRLDAWRPRDHALNALSWTSYLFIYEFFFRGFLLLGLAAVIEPALALALVTMIYAAVHIDRYPGELFGTLVSGLGFGAIALETGSILVPWLAHTGLAVTTDFLAARAAAKALSASRG
jgi:membrane protease YdiL (CAAX protease family)